MQKKRQCPPSTPFVPMLPCEPDIMYTTRFSPALDKTQSNTVHYCHSTALSIWAPELLMPINCLSQHWGE